jgi:hypothetical protein
MSEMMKQVAEVKNHMKQVSTGAADPEDLPVGSAPVEASGDEEAPVVEAEATPQSEAPEEKAPAAKASPVEEEESIRIGDREFKSQAEALKYAGELEEEKLRLELYNQGVRDALQSNQPAAPAAPVEEEDFDSKFYTDPKSALKKVKEDAKSELRAELQAEKTREKMWDTFLTANPDIDRPDAERILRDNWETIGKMTDVDKAMKALATKTRSEYQRMAEKFKPRTELPAKRGQAVSTGSSAMSGVTPLPKEEKVLTFAEEMKRMRRQR